MSVSHVVEYSRARPPRGLPSRVRTANPHSVGPRKAAALESPSACFSVHLNNRWTRPDGGGEQEGSEQRVAWSAAYFDSATQSFYDESLNLLSTVGHATDVSIAQVEWERAEERAAQHSQQLMPPEEPWSSPHPLPEWSRALVAHEESEQQQLGVAGARERAEVEEEVDDSDIERAIESQDADLLVRTFTDGAVAPRSTPTEVAPCRRVAETPQPASQSANGQSASQTANVATPSSSSTSSSRSRARSLTRRGQRRTHSPPRRFPTPQSLAGAPSPQAVIKADTSPPEESRTIGSPELFASTPDGFGGGARGEGPSSGTGRGPPARPNNGDEDEDKGEGEGKDEDVGNENDDATSTTASELSLLHLDDGQNDADQSDADGLGPTRAAGCIGLVKVRSKRHDGVHPALQEANQTLWRNSAAKALQEGFQRYRAEKLQATTRTRLRSELMASAQRYSNLERETHSLETRLAEAERRVEILKATLRAEEAARGYRHPHRVHDEFRAIMDEIKPMSRGGLEVEQAG
jgi:hypothetical protein